MLKSMQLLQAQKLYQRHAPHVDSFPFKRLPKEMQESATQEEISAFYTLPFVRTNGDERRLIVNRSADAFKEYLQVFMALDSLPDSVLHDLYDLYRKKNVTLETVKVFDTDETARRCIIVLLPEILWAHGDNLVKSKIFTDWEGKDGV